MERETYPFDVLIVGAGPAGLAAAIRLAQKAAESGQELEIGVVEKAGEPGLHCMSGAIFNPRALEELIPDYEDRGFPGGLKVSWDGFYYMTSTRSLRVPGFLVPPPNRNDDYYTLSIQRFAAWLGEQAEEAGVTILSDNCGVEILYGEKGEVRGVRTGDKGLGAEGEQLGNFEPGYDLTAKVTLFAEGGHGTLSEDLIHEKGLRAEGCPQVHSLGVKELIKNEPAKLGLPADEGFAVHTLGWPMPGGAFGGGFLYHLGEGLFSVGYVLGLGWGNPQLDMHAVFNEYKKHPLIQRYIRGGEVLSYGAKTIPEGGYFAVPTLQCDGAMLVGDAAGLVNVRTLKGIHFAMKSGMLAADAALDAVVSEDASAEKLAGYRKALDESWVMKELYRDRNFRSSFDSGLHSGLVKSFLNDFTGGGKKKAKAYGPDHEDWAPAGQHVLKTYPRDDYDASVILDKSTDVHLSGTSHREDQPNHISILDASVCQEKCIPTHGVAPCTNFCPAEVYEMKSPPVEESPIQVNFSNCVHCRTCVIADPCDVDGEDRYQNIQWRAPAEGGPKYLGL